MRITLNIDAAHIAFIDHTLDQYQNRSDYIRLAILTYIKNAGYRPLRAQRPPDDCAIDAKEVPVLQVVDPPPAKPAIIQICPRCRENKHDECWTDSHARFDCQCGECGGTSKKP